MTSDVRHPLLLFLALFAVYNSNGREIGNYDSQPPRFTAVAIARDHTARLDTFVCAAPQLAERPGFALDRHGHWRSAYPPAPGFIAGLVGLSLSAIGVWDPSAPLAGPFVAKLTASALTALAVTFMFLTAQRYVSRRQALLVALGAGLGTNLWAQTSQTLWQSETAIAALALAVWRLDREERTAWSVAVAAAALGVAVAARAQLAPAVAVIVIMILWRRRLWEVVALTPIAVLMAATVATNLYWFGHPLGARPQMEAAATLAHAVASPVGNPLMGALGLLASPSRGILVFSPIVVIVVASGLARMGSLPGSTRWFALAAAVQCAVYASYSAWWGGHSYGPRLLLDVIPLVIPLAASGLGYWVSSRPRQAVATALLTWSIVVSGTGAFVFPHERWNTSPVDVDRHHERLWDWRDPQFVRCWTAGMSPRNFQLFSSAAFRRERPDRAP